MFLLIPLFVVDGVDIDTDLDVDVDQWCAKLFSKFEMEVCTALKAAYTVDTVVMVYTVDMVCTVDMLYTVDTAEIFYTVYFVQTALRRRLCAFYKVR